MKGGEHDSGKSRRFSPVAGAMADLPPEALAAVSDACRWEEFAAGQIVISAQESDNDVLFIQSGRVRTCACSPEGKSVTYREIGPGDVVGDFAAIDGLPRSADVIAVEPTRVGRISAEAYLDMLSQQPSLMLAQMRHMTRNIRGLSERLYQVTTLNVAARIQAYLLRRFLEFRERASIEGADLSFTLPKQSEIAAEVLTHREAVSRELGRLERMGILVRKGRSVKLDSMRLAKELGEI